MKILSLLFVAFMFTGLISCSDKKKSGSVPAPGDRNNEAPNQGPEAGLKNDPKAIPNEASGQAAAGAVAGASTNEPGLGPIAVFTAPFTQALRNELDTPLHCAQLVSYPSINAYAVHISTFCGGAGVDNDGLVNLEYVVGAFGYSLVTPAGGEPYYVILSNNGAPIGEMSVKDLAVAGRHIGKFPDKVTKLCTEGYSLQCKVFIAEDSFGFQALHTMEIFGEGTLTVGDLVK